MRERSGCGVSMSEITKDEAIDMLDRVIDDTLMFLRGMAVMMPSPQHEALMTRIEVIVYQQSLIHEGIDDDNECHVEH